MNNINLHELNLDNVGLWPWSIKMGVFLGLSCCLSVLMYYSIIQPNVALYYSLKDKEVWLKKNLEQKQQQMLNQNSLNQQLQTLATYLEHLLEQFPKKNEMPFLLEEMTAIGQALGLSFELFTPQSEEAGDFYRQLPIHISVLGSYSQLGMFLSHLAQMKRIIIVDEMSIEAMNDQNGEQLRMNFIAKIYRYIL